ncbi:MAG: hypothetical protein ACJ748_09395 [Flavisolibacter sp.]
MKRITSLFLIYFKILISILFISCETEHRQILYRKPDNSATLYLRHYTSLIPTIGPCGFYRNEDSYSIEIPNIKGQITSDQLKIDKFNSYESLDSSFYLGYIKFIKANKVDIHLYKKYKGITKALNINGKHKIFVENERSN